MSYADGWAALNLEMPARVPRTEYSVEKHWPLLRIVTGMDVDNDSPEPVKRAAQAAFMRAWNYGLTWNTLVDNRIFGTLRTDMGHAEYEENGVDRRNTISCPFHDPEEVLAFDPWNAYGPIDRADWTRRFEQDYAQKCAFMDDQVNMTGIYVTLWSGLIEIFGWEMLLLGAGTDRTRFGELANRYASWIVQFFEALAESTAPVVMIHDDMVWTSGPIVAPAWYRQFVFPNYRKLFAPLLDANKKILYTSDGNYTRFIDDVAGCGIHGFVMEPTTDMGYIAEKYGKTHVFVGNADTRILLSGTRDQIRTEVERCMAIGKACPGFFMAVGNHIPSNTPIENALYYNEIYDKLSRR